MKPESVPLDWSSLDWTDCHDEGDESSVPLARLLVTVVLGGISFHAEAVQVKDDKENCQIAVSQVGAGQLSHLYDLDGGTDWQEVELNGKQYVVFLVPHSR